MCVDSTMTLFDVFSFVDVEPYESPRYAMNYARICVPGMSRPPDTNVSALGYVCCDVGLGLISTEILSWAVEKRVKCRRDDDDDDDCFRM